MSRCQTSKTWPSFCVDTWCNDSALSCRLFVCLASFNVYIKCLTFLNISDLKHLDMTRVSLTDTFAIKGTQEKFTITISRQDDNNEHIPVTSRKSSNASNSSRSSTFNVQFIQDDISSSGYSDPGVISDNDLSPAASFHGSHEDLFKGTVVGPSDTDDDFIEEDIPRVQSSPRLCTKPASPRTRSKVGCYSTHIFVH